MLDNLQYIQEIPSLHLSDNAQKRQDELVAEIEALKKKMNALVLCHNYQKPEVHRVADYVGDSYGLSKIATEVDCDYIVFCGVRFMAETAYILNPSKTVLLPEQLAGCGLADTITGPQLREWKSHFPEANVVMYINCNADVKAECDSICTSSNALHVVESMPSDTVLFGPDANLASFVKSKSSKRIIAWEGYCPVHKAVTKEMLENSMDLFPNATVIVHPECNPDVVAMADHVLSTSEMLDVIKNSSDKEFIVGTEIGLVQKAQLLSPEKRIHPIYQHKSCDQSCACPYMKITSLNSVLESLIQRQHVVTVEESLRLKALRSVEKMLEIGLPKKG